jgi:2'-5' RNA ligase
LSNEQSIRSFIAVELPEEVRKGLKRIQTELALEKYSFVKSVSPEGIHLTLKFLGNVSPTKIKDIVSVMEQSSQGVAPFSLQITEVGAFPNMRRPRVVWVGIKGELDKLIGWQKRLDDGLVPLRFEKETRPFTPHLTLARLRETASNEDKLRFGEIVAGANIEVDYKFTVASLNLMRSQLLPTGAVYTSLAEVQLKT